MNCPLNSLNDPPFNPMARPLYSNTICPSYLHGDIPHYNLHNQYGLDHAKISFETLKQITPNKRPFLLSRSTSLTSGNWAKG